MADEKHEAPTDDTDDAPAGDPVVDEVEADDEADGSSSPVEDDAADAGDAEAEAAGTTTVKAGAKGKAPVAATGKGKGKVSTAKASSGGFDLKAKAATGGDDATAKPSAAKAKADAVVAERTVTRRVVTSKRVTPKAGAKPPAGAEKSTPSKARNAKVTESINARYTPPTPTYAKGPSPWWVPTIMFGLLIIGALVIMLNYMGVFGEAANIRLVIGLAFILGGIVTATQYR